MRRPRAGDERSPQLPGGAGAPPGGTTTPCEELADGGPQGLPEAPDAAAQKGPRRKSRRQGETDRQKARPGAVRRRDGAPRGATCRRRHVTKRPIDAPLGAPSPRFLRGDERPREGGEDYGVPGAAKNTGDGACADDDGQRVLCGMKANPARDRLEAALERIDDPNGEGARACLTVYRARRARRGRGRRCARPRRHFAGAARRRHRHHQGPVRRRRRGDTRRLQGAGRGGQAGGSRRAGGAPLARRRRRDRRQDQHDRVRLFRRRRQSAFRHAGQSGRSRARSRRLVVGRGGRGRRRHVRHRHRQRHRRLDAHSGRAVRHRRLQAEPAAHSDRRARFRCPTASTRSGRSRARSRIAPRPTR